MKSAAEQRNTQEQFFFKKKEKSLLLIANLIKLSKLNIWQRKVNTKIRKLNAAEGIIVAYGKNFVADKK